jgi:RimJ/RimL family protein N-acetyltransferase
MIQLAQALWSAVMDEANNLIFREIQPSDSALLETFFVQNDVPQVTETFTAFPLNARTTHFITEQSHKDKYYLLFLDGQPIGFSMLRGFDEGYSVPSFGIFIDHRFQGSGYGKKLLRLTVEEARQMGCEKVRLSVFGVNVAGRKIYETFGFRETQRSPIVRGGITDEKIIMIKELT